MPSDDMPQGSSTTNSCSSINNSMDTRTDVSVRTTNNDKVIDQFMTYCYILIVIILFGVNGLVPIGGGTCIYEFKTTGLRNR